MSGPLGVLLAGFSGLGEHQNHQRDMYAPAFATHPGFAVVGVMESLDSLTRSDVDVVSVCVPMAERVEVVTTAMRAGKHVLVDKPMAAGAADCAAIAAVAREKGRVCLPAHHQRFNPMIAAAGAAVARGDVGLPWNVQADLLVAGGQPVDAGELDNFAVYPLDVVHTLIGQRAVRMHARAVRGPGQGDAAVLLLDHEHGLTSTIVVGRTTDLAGYAPGEPAVHRYRVSGSHGVLDVDATKPAVTVHTKASTERRWHGAQSVTRMLDELSAAAADGRQSNPGPADAERVARLVEAAHRSMESGQPVDIPDESTVEARS